MHFPNHVGKPGELPFPASAVLCPKTREAFHGHDHRRPALKRFVQNRVAEGGYGTVSEYVRELIRNDQRQLARSLLEQELLHGVRSGPARRMTTKDWHAVRQMVRRRSRPKVP